MTYAAMLWAAVASLALLGAAASFPLRFGRAVFLSLGAASGLGGYVLAWLTTRDGWSAAGGLAAAAAAGFALGLLLGSAAGRVRGSAFVLFLLAVQVLTEQALYPLKEWTNGTNGLEGVPSLAGRAFVARAGSSGFVAGGLVLLIVAAYRLFDRSPLGLAARAFADDPEGVERLRVRTGPALRWVYALACAAAASAGGLVGLATGLVTPGEVGFAVTLAGAAVALLAARLPLPLLPAIFLAASILVGIRQGLEWITTKADARFGDGGWQLHFVRELAVATLTAYLLLPRRRGVAGRSTESPAATCCDAIPHNFGLDNAPGKAAGVSLNRVAVQADAAVIVSELSVHADPGETVALVGPNGCGKTTALRLLAGELRPTEGTVTGAVTDKEGTAYVHGAAKPFPLLTVGQNLFLAANAARTGIAFAILGTGEHPREVVRAWVAALGLGHRVDAAAQDLSWGQARRLLLAMVFCSQPWSRLFLDEPAAGLDPPGRALLAECLARIRERGTVAVLAEHDLEFVRTAATRIVRFDALPATAATAATTRRAAPASGEILLACRDLDAGYSGVPVVRGVEFELRAGEIVFVRGGNGTGKSTVLKTVAGLIQPIRGRVQTDYTRGPGGLAYVAASRLFPGRTVGEHIREATLLGHATPELLERYEIWRSARTLGARTVDTLSLGQRRIVRLALALAQGPRVVVLDEPSLNLSPTSLSATADDLCRFAEDQRCGILVADHAIACWAGLCTAAYKISNGTWEVV